jgi:glycosyltransferase involved in cell wall biosynthesis
MSIPVSVLVITRNEERDLPGCLTSVSWSDDIHVFDSLSTDGTVGIAKGAGAKVTQRKFDNYASHRNAALHGLDFKYRCILILDADERIPEELAREIESFISHAPPDVAACRIRRRDFFMGRWLKHASISQYLIRLVRPEKVQYEREVNEVLKVDGRIHDLQHPFDHFPFSKGIDHWMAKHNVYSTMEAKLIVENRRNTHPFSLRTAFLSRDFNERRYHQKELFYRLPFRPFLKWCYMMFVRRAFLDGKAGITYAYLQSIYEYMIVLKTRELEAQMKGDG